uniref:Uncharacterized protein n=1 Tax=Panagrolaimus sp. PS1159 TaxID=55785 RepID=A0AC35G4I4_9BILA
MTPEDEYRDPTEYGWPLETRLFATSRASVNDTKTLFLYAKGRTIDVDIKIPAPIDIQEKHNTIVAYFYAKQCLNPSDLDGLIIRLSAMADPSVTEASYADPKTKSSYTATYNKEYNRFDVQHICSDTKGILTKPTVNLENHTSILKFECFDFMDPRPLLRLSRINNFHVEIMADNVQCDFFVYFSNATVVIPPKFDGKLVNKNLPLGVTISASETNYQISLLNETTVKYSSNKTLPLWVSYENCQAFETELQINDGCSLIFKLQNNTLTLKDRGIELQQTDDWRHFFFAINENTLTLVKLRKNYIIHGPTYMYKKTIQTYAEYQIEQNDTIEYKSTAFCPTDKKNMKIHVKPINQTNCRTAKLVLAGHAELLAEDSSVTTKASNKSLQTTQKSSESSQSAGFEWWYGLIIGIVVLVFIGGIITFCLYRNGIIFKEKMPKNESILPVVAPVPVAKTPIRDVNEDREDEKEEEEKDSKKDEKKKPKKGKK